MKKTLALTALLGAALVSTAAAAGQTVSRSTASLSVDGKDVPVAAYNIADNNYFKLRDVAQALSGSNSQFSVSWSESEQTIVLRSGYGYVSVGGELNTDIPATATAEPTTATVWLDGKQTALTAYEIGGNNYFKLRDIGQALDFEVTWDEENQQIVVDTDESYTMEDSYYTDGVTELVLTTEHETFEALNAYREKKGLSPLQYSEKIAAVARAHSYDMMDHHYFSTHTMTYGSAFMEDQSDRLRAAGVSFQNSGEAIVLNSKNASEVIQDIVDYQRAYSVTNGKDAVNPQLLANPETMSVNDLETMARALQDVRMDTVGIGFAVGANGYKYWTIDLIQSKTK
jgi:uncharacterized protein YkwD